MLGVLHWCLPLPQGWYVGAFVGVVTVVTVRVGDDVPTTVVPVGTRVRLGANDGDAAPDGVGRDVGLIGIGDDDGALDGVACDGPTDVGDNVGALDGVGAGVAGTP